MRSKYLTVLLDEINQDPKKYQKFIKFVKNIDSFEDKKVAEKEAAKRGDDFIAGELFLLVLTDDKGELGKAIKSCGVNRKTLETAIEAVRGGQSVNSADSGSRRCCHGHRRR